MPLWLAMVAVLVAALAAVALPVTLWPSEALAQAGDLEGRVSQNFRCVGRNPQGTLFQSPCAPADGFDGFLGRIVCGIENMLGDLLSNVFCGMRSAIMPAIVAIATLYVVINALLFITGLVQYNAGELGGRVLKVSLFLAFTLNAELLIGFFYTGFMSAAKGMVDLVLSVNLYTDGTTFGVGYDGQRSAFDSLGALFKNFYGDDSIQWAGRVPFVPPPVTIGAVILAIATIVPGGEIIVGLIIANIYMVCSLMLRAIVGYLLALATLTFLVSMSWIFFSFGLFRTTQKMFDTFITQLIAAVVSMPIVFGFIGLTQMQMENFSHIVNRLRYMIVPALLPVNLLAQIIPIPIWGWVRPPTPDEAPMCYTIPGHCTPMTTAEIIKDPTIIYKMVLAPFVSMFMIGYAVNALIKEVPVLAQHLAGAASGILYGGMRTTGVGTSFQVIPMFGTRTLAAMETAARTGYSGTKGSTIQKMVGGLTAARRGGIEEFRREIVSEAAQGGSMSMESPAAHGHRGSLGDLGGADTSWDARAPVRPHHYMKRPGIKGP